MFSDEPDPTLFTTLRQRHLRQNARRTAEKARGKKKTIPCNWDGGQLQIVPICSVTLTV